MVFILSIIVAVIAFVVWRNAAGNSRRGNSAYRPIERVSLLALCVFAAVALLQCFTQIPAGHVGVVDFFGVVSEETLRSGINPVNPMANVIKVSIQTQEHKETMQVLSREGLTIVKQQMKTGGAS